MIVVIVLSFIFAALIAGSPAALLVEASLYRKDAHMIWVRLQIMNVLACAAFVFAKFYGIWRFDPMLHNWGSIVFIIVGFAIIAFQRRANQQAKADSHVENQFEQAKRKLRGE